MRATVADHEERLDEVHERSSALRLDVKQLAADLKVALLSFSFPRFVCFSFCRSGQEQTQLFITTSETVNARVASVCHSPRDLATATHCAMATPQCFNALKRVTTALAEE